MTFSCSRKISVNAFIMVMVVEAPSYVMGSGLANSDPQNMK